MQNLKKYIAGIILIFSTLSCAQETFAVKGFVNPSYGISDVSREMQQALFIAMKGDLMLPEYIFYLDLEGEDIRKTGNRTIAYIPLDEEQFFYEKKKFSNLKMKRLIVEKDTLYYSLRKEMQESSINPRILNNPSIKDTIQWSDVGGFGDFRITKDYIDNLDNKGEVTVQSVLYAMLTDGTCSSSAVFEKATINAIAAERLNRLRHLFPDTEKFKTKSEWQDWFAALFKEN